MNTTARWGWILFSVFAIVLLASIGLRDLWNPDEPRFAEIARNMIQTGNYLVPQINGEVYTDKPPAFFWLSALAAKVFSSGEMNEFSARLPSVVAGIAALLLTFWLGKEMFGSVAGIFAMMVLATTYRFWWQAGWAQMDMLLSFFIFAALALFWKSYCFSLSRRNKFLLFASFYLALAGGFLTKGPIGILIPCGIIFFFLIWEKRFSFLLKMWIPLGVVILLFTAGGWVWGAYKQAGLDYLYQHFIYHNFVRYTEPWGHVRPFYYYFYNFPADCLPWVFFLPFALVRLWKSETKLKSSHRFLFVWFALIFLFFSLSDSKRNLYLLPLFPAVALFLGEYFANRVPERRVQKAFVGFLIFGFTVFATANLVAYPLLNQVKSAQKLTQQIKPMLKEKGQCASYRFFKESFLYYLDGTGRKMEKIDDPKKLAQFLKAEPHNLALVQDDDIEAVQKELPVHVVLDRRVGSDHYYVVAWQPIE